MADQVFISLGPDRAELFRWSTDRLVQATTEREGEGGPAGGIHLGRVVKLDRTLNAAFVEIGLARPGLLPLKKHDSLSEGDAIAVQVRRDSREDKGVRLARFNAKPNLLADKHPPALLIPPPMLWQTALRALVPERVDAIHCDRRGDGEKIIATAPELAKKVQHTPRRNWEMNDAAANEEIAAALQEEVPLSSGGSLLFEPVRTLCAIDVNSGDAGARRGEGGGINETALAVNLAAAREIPIQLALRNIGGVIVIDFIDIEHRGKRDQVVEALREAVIVDPAIDWVGNMSRLGLVELKRRRSGPTLAEMWLKRTQG
ncbi:ribonuclease E/G [Dongia sedimenti]|uniref:Ribonuclease E/G n=1 Tax=Dongia sedimenti TaxID=3064282 RepID=A0ABU0YKP3_9PROT|nr:ribonuclease E/G [Rhodospirillaceae bacterium R-7]